MATIRSLYLFLVDAVQTLLVAASVFLVIYIFLFRPFQVNGQSMHPSFKDKEYVLTNLIVLRLEKPERGDVIVFKSTGEQEKDFIKRVIGVPDDTLDLKEGKVYVNNQKLDENLYLSEDVETHGGNFLKEGKEVKVPDGKYFVMGDNRPFSSDSRDWGFIDESQIIGKSFFVYWPPEKVRLIKNPF